MILLFIRILRLYRVRWLRFISVCLHVFLQFRLGWECFRALLTVRLQRLQPGVAAFVPRQLWRALELELAHVAGIRPLPCVNTLVQLSLAEGKERLLAVATGERPFSCVDEIVSCQCVRFGEALPTVGAGVRAGASVGHDMLLLGFLALKTFVTLRAGVGLVIHMWPVMFGELSFGQKALPALGAEERLLPGVHPLMSGQHRHQGEPLGAVGALERTLACVNTEVLHEQEAQRELLAALVTLVRPLACMGGQVSLHIGPPSVRLLAVGAFELMLHLMHLPVLRAC